MSQSSGFDMSKMSTASKILLGGGVLYLIDTFLDWNRVCILGFCEGINGWYGLGFISGLLVLVIVVMEAVTLAGVNVNVGTPQMRSMVEAAAAGVILVITLLKVLLIDNEFLAWPAWLAIVLALVIGYGGWMRWQEAQATGGGPSPMGGSMGGGEPSA